jgi:O-antigen/teichoic acid export membrane protein
MIKAAVAKVNKYFSKGHERSVTIKKNLAASLLLKGGSIAIGLILIPLTIHYVSATQYGIWLTLSSIINWFSFFDIGLGNGLKNKLAASNALGNYEDSKTYVSTTYGILTIISTCVFLLFFVANFFINWSTILNSPNIPGNDFNRIALIVVGFFCLQFVLQIINTVLTACLATAKVSLILFLGQFLSVIVIYILTLKTSGSLTNLVLTLGGVPLLVQLVASFWLYNTTYKRFAPSFKSINFKYIKGLLNLGGVFFIIQIGALILFQTDNIVITQIFGPKEVAIFNIAYKLFGVVLMLFTIIMVPFWSAFTDAYTKGDMDWVKTTLKKIKKIWLIFSFVGVLLFIISPFVYKIWLHGKVAIPLSLSFAMMLYVIATCWQTIYVFFLNGIGKLRLQLYLVIVTSIINIPLAILLGRFIGVAGITYSNFLMMLITGVLFYIQTNKLLNKTATGIFDK